VVNFGDEAFVKEEFETLLRPVYRGNGTAAASRAQGSLEARRTAMIE
jgi:hypothetical protein